MKTIKIEQYSEIPSYFTGIVVYPNGNKFWFKEGKWHREDGPAIEWRDGSKSWLKEGNLHRTDGPAKGWSSGTKEWYLEGECYNNINLNNYVVLDSYKGKYNLTWYKLLTKDKVIEWPDIPGLIEK